MNEDKPKLKNQGFCIFHQKYWDCEAGVQSCCPLCTQKSKQAQPSPPTPRPDVEGIREWFRNEDGTSVDTDRALRVCDYALELEKRLKAAEEKLNQDTCNSGHKTLPVILWDCPECGRIEKERVRSLLADLVKAGKKHGVSHWSWCRKSENTGVSCTCGFVEIAAALIAAEQQLGESEGKS